MNMAEKVFAADADVREIVADQTSYGRDNYNDGSVLWLFDDGSELERAVSGEWIWT